MFYVYIVKMDKIPSFCRFYYNYFFTTAIKLKVTFFRGFCTFEYFSLVTFLATSAWSDGGSWFSVTNSLGESHC